jgi:prepilin-type N-terminal cleavage/methylation domain-containing protein
MERTSTQSAPLAQMARRPCHRGPHTTLNPAHGFTLLEASIVLLIIGLIAGGVLVGRDLIEAARTRQQLSQIERYNTAANTFRAKYNLLPGDMSASQAASLGFQSRQGTFGRGDGNGYINSINDPIGHAAGLGGETALFWTDLAAAQLIDAAFTQAGDVEITALKAQVPHYLPPASIGRGYIAVFGRGDFIAAPAIYRPENNFQLIEFTDPLDPPVFYGAVYISGGPLTPRQAYTIDHKTDDALPTAGGAVVLISNPSVQNLNGETAKEYIADYGFSSPATDCVLDGTPVIYNTAAAADRPICSLRIRAAF